MRLVDADALKQTFCAECARTQCENCSIDYHFNHAPTVAVKNPNDSTGFTDGKPHSDAWHINLPIVDAVKDVAKNATTTAEAVYNRYTDTAGNYHWTGAYSGEHIVRMDSGVGEKMGLIDADKLKDIISDTWILDRIDEQPTVDAVEVVRCKDCVCCDRDNGSPWCGLIGLHIDDDHYCAWGERKNDID